MWVVRRGTPRSGRALIGLAAGILGLAALIAASSAPARADLVVGIHEGVPWPIVPPPIALPIPRPPPRAGVQPPPAPAGGARVLEVLEQVRARLRQTRYQHATVVREREGLFFWDCSGMAAWVLRRAAPHAMRAITRGRPVARDFARVIARAPPRRPRAGWQRIERVEDARPGDVFAWRRPRGFPSRNTGHVGFVVEAPIPVPAISGAWAVRIADSTSWGHEDDTRPNDGVGGFGLGTLVFLTDAMGRGTHYGWAGTRSEGYVVTPIVFGRVVR